MPGSFFQLGLLPMSTALLNNLKGKEMQRKFVHETWLEGKGPKYNEKGA
jgi:hypothetical protein